MPRPHPGMPCELRNTILHHVVKVDASFGSDIQRAVALRSFRRMLTLWKETVEASHMKNKVIITQS